MGDVEWNLDFKSTAPQKDFLLSPAKFTIMLGGYGSGKSTGLVQKGILRFSQNPGLPGMLIASDYGRLARDILPTLHEHLDLMGIDWEWSRSALKGMTSRAMLIGKDWLDVTLHMGSADSPDSLKGPTLAFILVEEATLLPRYIPGKSEPLWSVLISRLRAKDGTLTVDLSGTPEGKANWTCDEGMFERAPSDPAKVALWMEQYRIVRASSWTNEFLPAGYVQNMVDNLDPTQIKEKVDGSPAAGVGGAAYYAFDVQRNVAHVRYDPFRGPVLIGLDFNVNPMTASLAQFHRNVVGIFEEIVLPNSNTPSMARAIIRRLTAMKIQPQRAIVFPDASGRARSTVGESDFRILKNAGLINLRYDRSGNPRVRDRLAAMNGAMHHGRLVVDPKCQVLIRDLSQVATDNEGNLVKTGNLTHMSDNVGYIVVKVLPIRADQVRGDVGFI